jgi:hypothetical protein
MRDDQIKFCAQTAALLKLAIAKAEAESASNDARRRFLRYVMHEVRVSNPIAIYFRTFSLISEVRLIGALQLHCPRLNVARHIRTGGTFCRCGRSRTYDALSRRIYD